MNADQLRPSLVIINGPPGSGKTTLAPLLADTLQAICISRDAIKKAIFEGWEPTHPALQGQDYSPETGGARFNEGKVSWEIFFWALRHTAPLFPVVAESPFNHAFARRRIEALVQELTIPVIEVFLTAPPALLLRRVEKRAASPDAHAIEARFSLETARGLLENKYDPVLSDPCRRVRVDTRDLSAVDIVSVANDVRRIVATDDVRNIEM